MKEPEHYKDYVGHYGKRFYLPNVDVNIRKIDGFRHKIHRTRNITSECDEFHFVGDDENFWYDCEDTAIITNEFPIKDIEWVLNVRSENYRGWNPFLQEDRDKRLQELGMNIIERGNLIISEFMDVVHTNDMNYHEDWNKLIPVWIKLPTTYDMNNNQIRMDYIINTILKGDVKESWMVIVGYLNKYIVK